MPLAEHDIAEEPDINRAPSFNSRAPRGARQAEFPAWLIDFEFQFTCPSRSTTFQLLQGKTTSEFQFTCPSRSTTAGYSPQSLSPGSFNSRAPRGARPASRPEHGFSHEFQFTCPSRSTTFAARRSPYSCGVSIHVPLAEHDASLVAVAALPVRFNSRAPRGARR